MYKKIFILLILAIFITGCGKKEKIEEITSESTTDTTIEEIITTEETKEEIIASGSGKDDSSDNEEEYSEIEDDTILDTLPDTIEPLDNDDVCNPRITNASEMFPRDYNRHYLLNGVLTYMYNYNIKDDVCTEIHIDESMAQGTMGYKMTLKFQNHEDCEVMVFCYEEEYVFQPYYDYDEVGFTME